MTARFTVLASGSSGNAALLEHDRFGLLIDCGLHPRGLGTRLTLIDRAWPQVSAVVLTHTHGDHWNAAGLLHLHRMRIPLFVHPKHADHLARASVEFQALQHAGLVHHYTDDRPTVFAPGLRAVPLRVPHDSDPTFAFRFDGRDANDRYWALGYASDLGHATPELVAAFDGVDVLAVEYNHDEELERGSGRPFHLIQRVLGKNGHLSNRQAAEFTRRVSARLRTVVQLHLSRHCNTSDLAMAAAVPMVDSTVTIVTATQDAPISPIELSGTRAAAMPLPALSATPRESVQLRIPGMS